MAIIKDVAEQSKIQIPEPPSGLAAQYLEETRPPERAAVTAAEAEKDHPPNLMAKVARAFEDKDLNEFFGQLSPSERQKAALDIVNASIKTLAEGSNDPTAGPVMLEWNKECTKLTITRITPQERPFGVLSGLEKITAESKPHTVDIPLPSK